MMNYFRNNFGPQHSPRQSAIADGFAEAKCFYSNYLGKNIARGDYFPAKYIFSLQFLILISQQNFCLQKKDITCMC